MRVDAESESVVPGTRNPERRNQKERRKKRQEGRRGESQVKRNTDDTHVKKDRVTECTGGIGTGARTIVFLGSKDVLLHVSVSPLSRQARAQGRPQRRRRGLGARRCCPRRSSTGWATGCRRRRSTRCWTPRRKSRSLSPTLGHPRWRRRWASRTRRGKLRRRA